MQITPHFGSYRSQSLGIDPFQRKSSTPTPTVPNTSAPVSTAPASTTNVDLNPVGASSFDADTVSKNILSFVQRRLTQAAQQGASKEQLTKLLDEAREGATSGFDQAIAQLKGSGDFSDALSSGIGAALQKVDKGFDDLAKQFGIAANNVPTDTPAPQANNLSQLAASYSAKFSSRQSVDLIVKTADGDTVRLQLDVKNKQSIRASYQADANGQQLNISSKQRSSAGLSIRVDGNLDADELAALDDLLDQVGDLADTFFGGDVQAAAQQASTLDFSNPELSSLSLNLHSEVRSREKIAAYQQVQDASSESTGTNSGAPALSSLADALASLVPKASTAANPASLLKQLLAAQIGVINSGAINGTTTAGAAGQQSNSLQTSPLKNSSLQNNPLLNFANRLLTALGADQPAAQTSDKPAAIAAPNTSSSVASGATKPGAA
jgi:hypothetical protein